MLEAHPRPDLPGAAFPQLVRASSSSGVATVVHAGTGRREVAPILGAARNPALALPPAPSTSSPPVGPPPAARASRPVPRPPASGPAGAGVSGEGFDPVELRAQDREGQALYLKGRRSGRLFRVSAVRDPAQPRLWCLLVERFSAVGIDGVPGRGVIGAGGLGREAVNAALREVGTDPAAWLGQPRHGRLRDWLRRDEPLFPTDAAAPDRE